MSRLFRFLVFFISVFPVRIINLIERISQEALGKGFGTSTLEREVTAVLQIFENNYPSVKKIQVFDIGANKGEWSAALLHIGGKHFQVRTTCFEPSRSLQQELIARFSSEDYFSLVPLALGEFSTTSTLHSDSIGSGMASLSKRRLDHFDISLSIQENVQVEPLEKLFREGLTFPDIMKIDVEGHELAVLRGTGTFLRGIKLVQFEFGGANLDTHTNFQDFWYFFKEFGFDLFRIAPTKIIPVTSYSEALESYRTTNYIAVNKNLQSVLELS